MDARIFHLNKSFFFVFFLCKLNTYINKWNVNRIYIWYKYSVNVHSLLLCFFFQQLVRQTYKAMEESIGWNLNAG